MDTILAAIIAAVAAVVTALITARKGKWPKRPTKAEQKKSDREIKEAKASIKRSLSRTAALLLYFVGASILSLSALAVYEDGFGGPVVSIIILAVCAGCFAGGYFFTKRSMRHSN